MVRRASVIQDGGVRHPTFFAVLSALTLAACAHTNDEMHAATPSTETEAASTPATIEREVIAVDTLPPPQPSPVSRPRLSQTITLGQGTEAPYTPPAPRPQPQAGGPTQNVVVNNNIVVQGTPGYYGYGGYQGYGGYGHPASFGSSDAASRGGSQWSATGWEGARRTAAPGQTPGIGGNWSPPPSYGPAQMK
jgi:hypothetical protein